MVMDDYTNMVDLFPFTNVDYDDFMTINYISKPNYDQHLLNTVSTDLNFSSFNYKDYGVCDYEKDTDPDKKIIMTFWYLANITQKSNSILMSNLIKKWAFLLYTLMLAVFTGTLTKTWVAYTCLKVFL